MAEDKDRPHMEVGGTGTAKVKFKDALENDVEVKNVQWASSGNVVVSGDPDEPSTARLFASGPGAATIRAQAEGVNGGFAEARLEVVVLERDSASTGEITISDIKAAPVRKEPAAAKEPPSHTGATGAAGKR